MKDVVFVAAAVMAAVSFGAWQHSPIAGATLFCVLMAIDFSARE